MWIVIQPPNHSVLTPICEIFLRLRATTVQIAETQGKVQWEAVVPIRAELDEIDIRILRELQNEGRITNVELSDRVGISAPPCLRRMRKLEEAGIIRGYRAMLNAASLGYDLVAFCMIGLGQQSEVHLRAFADKTLQWPIVRQSWMVSGESDFLLHCVATDLSRFQDFVIDELTAADNVDTVRSMLTIRQIKNEGPVELGE